MLLCGSVNFFPIFSWILYLSTIHTFSSSVILLVWHETFSLNLNYLTQGSFWSPDIHSSKHKDRRKGSLDVRSTSRGSDGEGAWKQMLLLVYKTLCVFVLIGHWLENQIHFCCCSNLRLFFPLRCFCPSRKLTAKALIDGPNPLDDHRGSYY